MWKNILNGVGWSLLLVNMSAQGAYRCVKDGQTYFSDRQCEGEQHHFNMRTPKPASTEPSLNRTKRYLEALTKEKTRKQKNKDKQAEYAKKLAAHQKECARAKDSLKTYQQGGRLYQKTTDGGRAYIDDEARQKAIEGLQQQIKNKCNN